MPITNGSLVTMKSGKAVGTVMDIVHIYDLLTEAIILWDGESFPRRTDIRTASGSDDRQPDALQIHELTSRLERFFYIWRKP